MPCRRFVYWGKQGGLEVGKTRCCKGSKIMAVADAHGIPIAIHVRSASPAEVTLAHETLKQSLLADVPERLIADRAYDSEGLARTLAAKGIELIAPHRYGHLPQTSGNRHTITTGV